MITLDEAKAHLRVDHGDEDALIQSLIDAALLTLENVTGRKIRDREEAVVLDGFEPVIRLPWWPVQAVEVITYLDRNGVEQTQPSWALDLRTIPAKLTPADGQSWPETKTGAMTVTIQAQVGYVEMPEDLKRAALLLIGQLYENREPTSATAVSEIPLTLKYLLQGYVIPRV